MNDDQTPQGTDEIQPEIPAKPEEPQQPTPQEPDYKEKFSQSSRENQLLLEHNKALEAEIAARNQTNEPTDSELRTAFPSWDAMSDTEKDLARRTLGSERAAKKATQLATELQTQSSWNTSIELVIASNPALQGKEQAFRQYASRPQYKGVSMDVLVPAFLHTTGSAPAPKTTPMPSLLTGTGGPKTAPKVTGLTMEQLAALRNSDPKAYEQYVKTHDIEVDE